MSLPVIRESSSGATAATRDPRRVVGGGAHGVHIQRSLDESAVRRAQQQPHSAAPLDEERLGHGQQQEVSLSDTAIGGKTGSESRLDEVPAEGSGSGDKEPATSTGARGKVRLGELNKAKSSSTSQLSQAGTSCDRRLCRRRASLFLLTTAAAAAASLAVAWVPSATFPASLCHCRRCLLFPPLACLPCHMSGPDPCPH